MGWMAKNLSHEEMMRHMAKLYAISDIHGYLDEFRDALSIK